jgi:ABC-type phosphate transport system substrate-binding protein
MSSTPEKDKEKDNEKKSDEKPTVTLPATVEKIVQPVNPKNPEMAEIHIEGADPLYREIRVENTLTNDAGEEVKLKKGSRVDVTIEAEADATLPKKPRAAS